MRKFLSILSYLLGVVIFAVGIVAVSELDSHTHTYEDAWSSDAESHWHAATCEHTEEKGDVAVHADEDGNGKCDVCDYSMSAGGHNFASIYSSDETGHWYACTDDGCTEKSGFAPHDDADRDGECDDCFRGGFHTHSWNTAAWQYNDTQHWNPAICGSDCPDTVADLQGNIANHVDEDENGECDVCDYDGMHKHTFDEEDWIYDETGHWYASTCEHDRKGSFAEHVDVEGDDFTCDVCGYVIHEHTFADTLTQGDGEHYYAATCGHNVKKDAAACADGDSDNECDVCGAHVHNVDDSEWVKDETGHWHATTCEHDPAVKADFAEHIDEDADNTCDVCTFHAHTWATEWSGDTNEHWYAATCDGHEDARKDVGPHVDTDSDTLCDTCGLSTIGPIAGVNKVTAITGGVDGVIESSITVTGDDSKSYVIAVAIDKYAGYDATTDTLRIYTKTRITGITENSVAVESFVKDGVTYEVGSVVPKSMYNSFGIEMYPKVSATDAGISPNSVAFQFRANLTINSYIDDEYYNSVLVNEGAAGAFSFGIRNGKIYLSVSAGWIDTGVEVGEEFAFAVRIDRITNGGKTSYLMTLYANGVKILEKSFASCPDAMNFKTYSATRGVEFLMTDVYCDSYGIRYEGATATTTTTVWEKDGAFSTTEIADGNKYDIEWYNTGALTTDDVTGVVTSQDKRIAIKSIKDAEGNETTITWSGKTYKAGECYIPKDWLGLGTAFWGSAPSANFTAAEADKAAGSTLLYAFETTLTVNDYQAYAASGVGNVLEFRLYSGNTEKAIVFFNVGGGASRFIDLNWDNNYTYSNATARGNLGKAMTIRVEIHESQTAGQVDIKLISNGAEFRTKTVDAFDLTKVAFDAPSNARYQTTVFENTTFTKYVAATPAE